MTCSRRAAHQHGPRRICASSGGCWRLAGRGFASCAEDHLQHVEPHDRRLVSSPHQQERARLVVTARRRALDGRTRLQVQFAAVAGEEGVEEEAVGEDLHCCLPASVDHLNRLGHAARREIIERLRHLEGKLVDAGPANGFLSQSELVHALVCAARSGEVTKCSVRGGGDLAKHGCAVGVAPAVEGGPSFGDAANHLLDLGGWRVTRLAGSGCGKHRLVVDQLFVDNQRGNVRERRDQWRGQRGKDAMEASCQRRRLPHMIDRRRHACCTNLAPADDGASGHTRRG